MRVEVLGDGEPEHAVVACVHGNEPCGWHAFNMFKREGIELKKPLKLVLANERAFRLGKRSIDADLNRSLPGNPESEKYEERLAVQLRNELEGTKILDLHSSESEGCPFAITVGQEREKLDLARSTGLEQVVDMSFVDGGLTQNLEGVVAECGYKDEETSADMAFRIMKNFLAAEGVIDAEHKVSEPEIFETYGKAEGSGFDFVARNFELVREGEVFAEKPGEARRAEEDFYPVLMSTDGYSDMIGFKARKRDI
ncbi:MAG: succinylglutamate desuccinylase/aspartoacylase family protein [Candidatus Nanosalina sp.]